MATVFESLEDDFPIQASLVWWLVVATENPSEWAKELHGLNRVDGSAPESSGEAARRTFHAGNEEPAGCTISSTHLHPFQWKKRYHSPQDHPPTTL